MKQNETHAEVRWIGQERGWDCRRIAEWKRGRIDQAGVRKGGFWTGRKKKPVRLNDTYKSSQGEETIGNCWSERDCGGVGLWSIESARATWDRDKGKEREEAFVPVLLFSKCPFPGIFIESSRERGEKLSILFKRATSEKWVRERERERVKIYAVLLNAIGGKPHVYIVYRVMIINGVP